MTGRHGRYRFATLGGAGTGSVRQATYGNAVSGEVGFGFAGRACPGAVRCCRSGQRCAGQVPLRRSVDLCLVRQVRRVVERSATRFTAGRRRRRNAGRLGHAWPFIAGGDWFRRSGMAQPGSAGRDWGDGYGGAPSGRGGRRSAGEVLRGNVRQATQGVAGKTRRGWSGWATWHWQARLLTAGSARSGEASQVWRIAE